MDGVTNSSSTEVLAKMHVSAVFLRSRGLTSKADDLEKARTAVAALIEREAALVADRDAARRERDEEAEERENAERNLADLANRMVYQGNSVACIASKAKNYGDALLEAWAALNDSGYHRPAGEMPNLAEAIKQHCDALAAEVKALRDDMLHIATANPKDWDVSVRDQFQEWAQSRARNALARASAATGGDAHHRSSESPAA